MGKGIPGNAQQYHLDHELFLLKRARQALQTNYINFALTTTTTHNYSHYDMHNTLYCGYRGITNNVVLLIKAWKESIIIQIFNIFYCTLLFIIFYYFNIFYFIFQQMNFLKPYIVSYSLGNSLFR